jgi:hypothetical protein
MTDQTNKPYYIYADIEADGFRGNQILQIAAVTQDNRQFNIYLDPEGPLPLSITNFLGLYYYNKNLYKNGRLIPTFKTRAALKAFTSWISNLEQPITLVFHNGFSFDCGVLVRHLIDHNVGIPSNLIKVADTLPFFRRTLKAPEIKGHTLSCLASFYELPLPSHDALTDSITLKNICEQYTVSTNQTIDIIFEHCTREITDYTNKHIYNTPIPKLKKIN